MLKLELFPYVTLGTINILVKNTSGFNAKPHQLLSLEPK